MKILPVIFLVIVFPASKGRAEQSVMRDAATPQQLSAMFRKVSLDDPMKRQQPVEGPDPSVANRPASLLENSDMLCFNGAVTLVPKRAVLQVPKQYADRMVYKPGSKLMSWSEFYALNRGWITTLEVSRSQAEGAAPIPAETTQRLSKTGNLVVATYLSGPISVLETKPEPVAENSQPAPKR